MCVNILSRYIIGVQSSFALLLVFCATFVPVVQPSGEDGVHLEYFCAEPDLVLSEEKNVPVIMMHGITDVKEIWNGIYENISSSTHRKVCVYDARNHGGSSWNETFDVDALVEDLGIFMNNLKIERAVLVGHSMGGLTAMKFALMNPSKVDGIFIEDIGIKIPEFVDVYVGFYIKSLYRSLSKIPEGADGPTAKQAVVDYLDKNLLRRFYKGLKQRLLESYRKILPLHLISGVWQWKTNLKAAEKILENPSAALGKMDGQYEGKALFIYGKSSVFNVGEQEADIRKLFPNVKFVAVEGANHLIHFDYPEFMEELLDFFK